VVRQRVGQAFHLLPVRVLVVGGLRIDGDAGDGLVGCTARTIAPTARGPEFGSVPVSGLLRELPREHRRRRWARRTPLTRGFARSEDDRGA
jgi:hypothetical protein